MAGRDGCGADDHSGRLRGCGQRRALHEQFVQQHHGQNPDERHLVALTHEALGVAPAFLNQRLDSGGREEPGLTQPSFLEQVANVLRRAAAHERAQDRRPIRSLFPPNDVGREEWPYGLAENVFLAEPGQLRTVGKSGGELRDAMVQERETPLHRVAHQHSIALRVKQVSGEERDDLDILGAAKGGVALKILGKTRAHARGRVARRAAGVERPSLEKPEVSRRVLEAKAMAVQRVVGVGESGAENVGQQATGAPEVVRSSYAAIRCEWKWSWPVAYE